MMTRQRGVTLIELMVTITIAAILMMVVAPGIQQMLASNRLVGMENELMASLNFARSEAIKRGTFVSLCPSSNGSSCTGSWANGWLIFIDSDDNGALASSSDTIRAVQKEASGTTYSIVSDNFASSITFGVRGSANSAGHFVLCKDNDFSKARAIVVSLLRQRIAADSNSDGVLEKNDGTAITSCSAI